MDPETATNAVRPGNPHKTMDNTGYSAAQAPSVTVPIPTLTEDTARGDSKEVVVPADMPEYCVKVPRGSHIDANGAHTTTFGGALDTDRATHSLYDGAKRAAPQSLVTSHIPGPTLFDSDDSDIEQQNQDGSVSHIDNSGESLYAPQKLSIPFQLAPSSPSQSVSSAQDAYTRINSTQAVDATPKMDLQLPSTEVSHSQTELEDAQLAELESSILSSKSLLEALLAKSDRYPVLSALVAAAPSIHGSGSNLPVQAATELLPEAARSESDENIEGGSTVTETITEIQRPDLEAMPITQPTHLQDATPDLPQGGQDVEERTTEDASINQNMDGVAQNFGSDGLDGLDGLPLQDFVCPSHESAVPLDLPDPSQVYGSLTDSKAERVNGSESITLSTPATPTSTTTREYKDVILGAANLVRFHPSSSSSPVIGPASLPCTGKTLSAPPPEDQTVLLAAGVIPEDPSETDVLFDTPSIVVSAAPTTPEELGIPCASPSFAATSADASGSNPQCDILTDTLPIDAACSMSPPGLPTIDITITEPSDEACPEQDIDIAATTVPEESDKSTSQASTTPMSPVSPGVKTTAITAAGLDEHSPQYLPHADFGQPDSVADVYQESQELLQDSSQRDPVGPHPTNEDSPMDEHTSEPELKVKDFGIVDDLAVDPPSPYLPPSSPPSSQVSDLCLPNAIIQPAFHVGNKAMDNEDLPEDNYGPLPSSSPIRSSEPPTSSPPQIFTSSPPREFDFGSPPSSPCIAPRYKGKAKDWRHDSPITTDINQPEFEEFWIPTKRARDDSDASDVNSDDREVKRPRYYSPPPPPNPKRATLLGQKKTHKKLVQPFRSPIVKIEDILAGKDGVYASGRASGKKSPPIKQESSPTPSRSSSVGAFYFKQDRQGQTQSKTATKDRTANAGKPFKALLAGPTTSKFGATTTGVNTSTTMQTLQARVQKLKQAIKIVNERDLSDDERLEALVTKWRTVGREVAWLVWDTVKDLEPGENLATPIRSGEDEVGGRGKKSAFASEGFQSGWGWDDGKKGKHDGFNSNWGWDDKQEGVQADASGEGVAADEPMDVDEDDTPVQNHSLGTMLRHLGIDPDTLGWDEDEGDFVGDP